MRRKSFIAMEMISIQDNGWGKELEKVIDDILVDVKNDGAVKIKCLEIEQMIMSRFGLKVRLIHNEELAQALPFYANTRSILFNQDFREDIASDIVNKDQKTVVENQIKLLKAPNGFSGNVDLERAKVSGGFSEVESLIYINFYTLTTTGKIKKLGYPIKLNSAEIVAIILHEIGHLFTYIEYSTRSVRLNQVMATIASDVLNESGTANLDYIYKELKAGESSISKEDLEDILTTSTNMIMGFKLFKLLINETGIGTANDVNNNISSEQLADSFCSRMGYGRGLVTALAKLNNSDETLLKRWNLSMTAFLMGALWDAYNTIAVIQLYGILPVIGPYLMGYKLSKIYFSIVITLISLKFSGSGSKIIDYDAFKIRYGKIRNEAVNSLKDQSRDSEYYQQTLLDITVMDEIIKHTLVEKEIIDRFCDVVFSKDRDALKKINEENLLESLANNDLFIKAAELKLL